MADPIGSIGAKPEANPDSDLHRVFEGGEKFMVRMQQLMQARDEANAAYANLEVGRNAHSAFAQARAMSAEAAAIRDSAQSTLEDARKKAKEILAEAQMAANTLAAEAAQEAANIRASAVSVKTDADARAAEAVDAANAALKAAQAKLKELEAKEANLLERIDAHENEHAAALDSVSKAQAAAESLQGALAAKLAALQQVILNISG